LGYGFIRSANYTGLVPDEKVNVDEHRIFQQFTTKQSFSRFSDLSGYNEIFVNGKKEFFDRNRIYGGIGYRLNKNLSFELGYMNQILNGPTRDQINLICFAKF